MMDKTPEQVEHEHCREVVIRWHGHCRELYLPGRPAEGTMRRYFGQAGHCHDIDGFLWHGPGACSGAPVNCDGKCCGYASLSNFEIQQEEIRQAHAALADRRAQARINAFAKKAQADGAKVFFVHDEITIDFGEVPNDKIAVLEDAYKQLLSTLYVDD